MPNPILPLWEHIPDGEPRLFGGRVYLYGSHDRPFSDSFCDSLLKVWSADAGELSHWRCHGDIFLSRPRDGRDADVTWLENGMLYAPDALQIGDKYYLFAYVFYGRGCVAASDRPEGPFRVLSPYTWGEEEQFPRGVCENGVLVDPGVLLDDDGKLYVYGGFEKSWMAQLNPEKPWQVIPGTYRENVIPAEEPFCFYEAASPRKIGNTYYLVYSPRRGSRLCYATASSPEGPFAYRGVIVDNGAGYPGGNNHGGLVQIGGQWYIFYHRMTNGSVFSRQACAERITILPDGSIPQAEMTSMGFDAALNPYEPVSAHWACVLSGGMVKYLDPLHTVLAGLKDGSVAGYKYFDFGAPGADTPLTLHLEIRGVGESGCIRVLLDDPETGEELAALPFAGDSRRLTAQTPPVSGRHALYFAVGDGRRPPEWAQADRSRELVQIERFVFTR